MLAKRIIGKLDIKSENVVKGVMMEGLKVVGSPEKMSGKYNDQAIDELIYIDTVASLYGRSPLDNVIESVTEVAYVPIAVGGGVHSVEGFHDLISKGAEKVAVNTALHANVELACEAASIFGCQAVVGSIHAKKERDGSWLAYCENGREWTGKDVLTWAKELESNGCGELIVMSVDRDGTMAGYDIELYKELSSVLKIPIIAAGGCGSKEHLLELFTQVPQISGAAISSLLHFDHESVSSIKEFLKLNKIQVRI